MGRSVLRETMRKLFSYEVSVRNPWDPQLQEQVNYLQKRRELMDYPTYQQQGWPIGSGSVESSHKLVVQARLKGPGRHWRPEHVNPMLALRLALLNDRWSESWQEQHRLRQQQRHLKRQAHQQQRFLKQQAKRQETHPPPLPVPSTAKPTRQKTGRTQAQYRWGRQTFSPRMLKRAHGAKNETHPQTASPLTCTVFFCILRRQCSLRRWSPPCRGASRLSGETAHRLPVSDSTGICTVPSALSTLSRKRPRWKPLNRSAASTSCQGDSSLAPYPPDT